MAFLCLDFCVCIIYLCGFLFPGLLGIQALIPHCSGVLSVIAQMFYWLYNNILNFSELIKLRSDCTASILLWWQHCYQVGSFLQK